MMSPDVVPPLDESVGISTYSTSWSGIGGRIRANPEDFAVSEMLDGRVSILPEGKYAVYRLAKRCVDTAHCLSDIFNRRRLRLKALGLKDATAVTTQFLCATGSGVGIESLDGHRYTLRRVGYVDRPLTAKSMTGNRFDIVIRDSVRSPEGFDQHDAILNYYGYQRFGSRRPVTHLVGRAILQSDYGGAVGLALSNSSIDTEQIQLTASDPSQYREFLKDMPKSMDTERAILRILAEGGSHRQAIASLPLYLRRLYLQAYQSYIFNRTLSAAHMSGFDLSEPHDGDICFDRSGRIGRYGEALHQRLAIPMVGYAYYKKTRFNPLIQEILDEQQIRPRDFYLQDMQEVSVEGGFRQARVDCTNYNASQDSVSFLLSRGSFATMILREIIKPADPVAAGF